MAGPLNDSINVKVYYGMGSTFNLTFLLMLGIEQKPTMLIEPSGSGVILV